DVVVGPPPQPVGIIIVAAFVYGLRVIRHGLFVIINCSPGIVLGFVSKLIVRRQRNVGFRAIGIDLDGGLGIFTGLIAQVGNLDLDACTQHQQIVGLRIGFQRLLDALKLAL